MFVLTLRPLPGVDAIRALRWVLKGLLRQHGLRCVDLGKQSHECHKSQSSGSVGEANQSADQRAD
jgi:hypothetical protein